MVGDRVLSFVEYAVNGVEKLMHRVVASFFESSRVVLCYFPWARSAIPGYRCRVSATLIAPYACVLPVLLLNGANPYESVHETIWRDILTVARKLFAIS